ncbi:MAG: AAA family ATPase [Promethearchaeati archaeon SRVP18_Atabeyarchaeia-1]
MKNGLTIASSGKGGVGKTSFMALVLKSFLSDGMDNILVVDADPDANMPEVLNIQVKGTVAMAVHELKDRIDDLPRDFNKDAFLETKVFGLLHEGEKFDLLVMGAVEKEGCFCMPNVMLANIVDTLSKNYRLILMDLPAGLEHVTRRTSRNVDLMYILTDSSKMGLETAARIKRFTSKIEGKIEKVVVLGNRLSEDVGEKIRAKADEVGASYGGTIPSDDMIAKYNMEGRSLLELPDSSTAFQAVRGILSQESFLS